MKTINYKNLVRPGADTKLLGETVWVGSDSQKAAGILSEGLIVKEHPVLKVKLDVAEVVAVYKSELWIRKDIK